MRLRNAGTRRAAMQKMGNRVIPEKGEGEGSRGAIRSVLVTRNRWPWWCHVCMVWAERQTGKWKMCRKNICEEEEEVGFGIHWQLGELTACTSCGNWCFLPPSCHPSMHMKAAIDLMFALFSSIRMQQGHKLLDHALRLSPSRCCFSSCPHFTTSSWKNSFVTPYMNALTLMVPCMKFLG